MKIILTILFSLFCLDTFCQDTAYWRTGDESSISEYNVQKSKDASAWTSIATIPKGKSFYSYKLPNETNYYRITAQGADTLFVTKPLKLTVAGNSVTLSKPVFKSTSLSWTAVNENNVAYYWIQKTRGTSTTQVTKTPVKGGGKYTQKINRTVYTYTYKITPVFKDGTKSTSVNFIK